MIIHASCPSKTHLVRPRGRVRCAALFTALALGGASIELQAAPPAETEAAATVRVVVDASTLGPNNEDYFEQQIAAGLRDGLIAEGFEVVEQGGATVRIRLEFFNEHHRDFLIFADVVREGRVAMSQRPVKCPVCVDSELIDVALGLLPALVEVLRTEPEQVPMEASSDPAPSGDGDGDVEPPLPAAIGPVGVTGGVVAALGVGALIGGAVELARGDVQNDNPDMRDSIGHDHTTPGKILLGVGAGALVVGVALLGVDLGMRNKQRNRARQTSIVPVLAPTNAGLALRGRF